MNIENCTFINCTVIIITTEPVSISNSVWNNSNTIVDLDLEEVEKKMIVYDNFITNQTPSITFGTFPLNQEQKAYGCPAKKSKVKPWPTQQNKEVENTMYIDKIQPIQNQQISYLLDRARTAFFELQSKLNGQFFIDDEKSPTTLKDFKDRIANGKFIVQSEDMENIAASDWDDEEDHPYYNIIRAIRWRDPAKKADLAGRDAAAAELGKKLTSTKDAIMIGTPADGLKALQDLEAWVPSNLPS